MDALVAYIDDFVKLLNAFWQFELSGGFLKFIMCYNIFLSIERESLVINHKIMIRGLFTLPNTQNLSPSYLSISICRYMSKIPSFTSKGG